MRAIRLNLWKPLGLLLGLATTLLGGCLSLPKQVPAEYFTPRRDLTVILVNRAAKPEFYSGAPQGAIAGSMYLTRESSMKKDLAGIEPQRITPLLKAALPKALADAFRVTDQPAPLVLEITIEKWGWSLEAGTLGLRTHTYQLYIAGRAEIRDTAKNNQRIYYGYIRPTIDLGMQPSAELSRAAFPRAVQQFADDLARYILKGKPR